MTLPSPVPSWAASLTPALALEPNCYADPTVAGPRCVYTLGLDSSLSEARGYDDVTGIGAPTSRFVAALVHAGQTGGR